jgi:hypothetical protein
LNEAGKRYIETITAHFSAIQTASPLLTLPGAEKTRDKSFVCKVAQAKL